MLTKSPNAVFLFYCFQWTRITSISRQNNGKYGNYVIFSHSMSTFEESMKYEEKKKRCDNDAFLENVTHLKVNVWKS